MRAQVQASAIDLVALLQSCKISPTSQRLEIAGVLFALSRHLSADQVLEEVNRGAHRVSKATVYNTLNLFVRQGLIRQVIVDPTKVFYDPNTHAHHHFYNVDTGELVDIESGDLAIGRLPRAPAGTRAEGVDVVIRLRNC